MEIKQLIHKIETKREELNKIVLSNRFDFDDKRVQQLSKELDSLIFQYLEYINIKKEIVPA
ncbi:MAG: aspartyl-phosphate phosphatase Spo0E family protein [Clostridiales bacterium]|nr:aspartyl-phosphate phosphatase Spo0E family protein [Clostridiales bacterium]